MQTVAGKYIFIISAYCKRGGSNDLCSVSIRKSGVEIAQGGPGLRSNGSDLIPNASIITDMNGTTDYVEGYVYNLSGSDIEANSGSTFSGALLSVSGGGDGSSSYIRRTNAAWTTPAAVSCQGAEKVIGGGCSCGGGNASVHTSYPSSDTQWMCECIDPSGLPSPVATAWAICDKF